MSFATVTNIATIIFCLAVLVQSVRMLRSFEAVKGSVLPDMIKALDMSTAQARAVLSELKATLSTDGARSARALADAEAVRDELGVMIGIANAAADRILEAASGASEEGDGDEDVLELDRAA